MVYSSAYLKAEWLWFVEGIIFWHYFEHVLLYFSPLKKKLIGQWVGEWLQFCHGNRNPHPTPCTKKKKFSLFFVYLDIFLGHVCFTYLWHSWQKNFENKIKTLNTYYFMLPNHSKLQMSGVGEVLLESSPTSNKDSVNG